MNLYENEKYQEDLRLVSETDLPWRRLQDKSILISGACGLVGSFLIDEIIYLNRVKDLNCNIIALDINEENTKKRFSYCSENDHLNFIFQDINFPIKDDLKKIDYVLHLASNTHPVAYANYPIETITTNIIGTKNMLDFAVEYHADRFVFASSNEIYGENRGDIEKFNESYCGYINSNTLRAGYPESKRCGEALCQAYIRQKGLDIVIPRLTRSYGPTMLMSDTKAISQFIRKAIAGENIVLKSEGTQYYSYTYVADAVSGILTAMLKGRCGEAYNIADDSSDIMLKDLAKLIADSVGKKVVFELPDTVEKVGYSTATKARLDGRKIKQIGWKPIYDIQQGIKSTISYLKSY